MKIRVALHCMASSEIAGMIPEETIREIKKTDPNPLFRAYVAAHEGEARGNLIGYGNIVKKWYRAVIDKLHEKIEAGLQLFHGHGATNEQAGRIPIGRVVGKKLKEIAGRWSSVVACYIEPAYRKLNLDVASIEASMDLDVDSKGNLIATDIQDVSAIALGNSEIETPGFVGATLLGQLQAFAKNKFKEENMTSSAEEIKQLIREAELHPSDLFGMGEIKADPIIWEQVKEKSASPEIYYEMREMKRELAETGKRLVEVQKENKNLIDQVKIKDDTLKTSQIEIAKTKVKPLFEKQKATRKLDEKQTKFIQTRLLRFIPQKIEDLEKEFNSYLDSEIDEYGRIAKDVFGIDEKTVGDDKDGDKGGGTGPEDKSASDTTLNKYLDPAKNPFIKLS